jgi:hypothetical protein
MICRLYGDGVLVLEEAVEIPDAPADKAVLDRLVDKHWEVLKYQSVVLKHQSVHMVELVFPDGCHFRIGTDPSLMVMPIRVGAKFSDEFEGSVQ